MDHLYKSHLVWRRMDERSAVRYCCFQSLSDGRYAVQNADYFHLPFDSERTRHADMLSVELFIEVDVLERCQWFASLEDAIRNHERVFSV